MQNFIKLALLIVLPFLMSCGWTIVQKTEVERPFGPGTNIEYAYPKVITTLAGKELACIDRYKIEDGKRVFIKDSCVGGDSLIKSALEAGAVLGGAYLLDVDGDDFNVVQDVVNENENKQVRKQKQRPGKRPKKKHKCKRNKYGKCR